MIASLYLHLEFKTGNSYLTAWDWRKMCKICLKKILYFPLLICTLCFFPLEPKAAAKVAVCRLNPHYLQDASDKPMVIIGFGNEEKNPSSVLDQLRGKISYQRAYVAAWNRLEDPNAYSFGRPWPMVNGKADMDTWNETYWANLRNYIESARDRGIIVGLTIWNGHFDLPGGKNGADSVWNAQYNVQGVQWVYNAKALAAFPNPRSTGSPAEKLVYYQRHWIDRLIVEIKHYPNVLIELNNEGADASETWWLFWAQYFKKAGDFVIAVNYEPGGAISDNTFSTTSLVDMKSYHGRTASDITMIRYKYKKVIVADADNACSNLNANRARRMAWRSFIRGGHWNDFVCSGTTFPDATKIGYYGKLLSFLKTRNIPFWKMTPNNKLVSSGLALAKIGAHYLIYTQASVRVDLSGASGTLNYEWYDPRTGNTVSSGTVQGGTTRSFPIPGQNDYVLSIASKAETTSNPS
jgi:Putative collagen-binding domain of a collagenase